MPQVQNSQDSVLAHALAGVAGLVIRHPRTVICLGIAAVGLSLALSTRMTYRTGRSDVVNLNSEFNQRYLEYAKEFGDKEDVVVVVHGRNRTEILPALEELSHDVAAKSEFFQAVFHDQIDFSKLRAKGLHYLNAAQLEEIERGLTQMAPLLAGEGNLASAREIAQTMMAGMQDSRQAPRPEEMAALEKKLLQMCQILSMALRSGGDYQSPWPDMSSMLGRLAEAEPQPVELHERPIWIRPAATGSQRRRPVHPEQRRHRGPARHVGTRESPVPATRVRPDRPTGDGERRDAVQ